MTERAPREPLPLGEPEGVTRFVEEWKTGWDNRDRTVRRANRVAFVAQLRRLIDTGGLENRAPVLRSPTNGE